MSIIWLSLRDRGIPQQTARTIIASWRDSSKKQYLASILQWGRFCVIRKIHPCRASVLDRLNFVQYLFNLSVSYSSINTARSALSFILPRNDCGSFGQHFLVKKFIRGVYNLRAPAPKYSYIWDVSVVLEIFRHLPENNLLSLKLLSLKLVMLVALVSGQRVQTLSLLDLGLTYSVYDSIVFVILDMTKTSRPGKSASQIVLSEHGQDKRLCFFLLGSIPIETLECRTSSKLFLGLQKPHKAVESQTSSRWLKATLRLSGVRIDIFSGYSTRAASSSKAKLAGLSVDSILECVGWSNEQTFARYYNKKIVDINAFANGVLASN